MHIAFRVDSSTIIGYGHVMRCLTLAYAFTQAFTKQQNSLPSKIKLRNDEHLLISFICRDHQGNINNSIPKADFKLFTLPMIEKVPITEQTNTWLGTDFKQDAQACIDILTHLPVIDLLIIDHYAIDHQWQKLLKPYYQKLLVIDDLANRKHICDFLLDQTFNINQQAYALLVPTNCHLFLGDKYILLREEFVILQSKALQQRQRYINTLVNTKTNILVSMGGTDPNNLSQLALIAIEQIKVISPNISATLIISGQSKHLPLLTDFCRQRPWINMIINSQNMANLMLVADIAIGACGGTAWERCCLGLPCLTTINAKNQQFIANNLSSADAIINLGWHEKITIDIIYTALHVLLNDKKLYKKMSDACLNVCDAKGANRIANKIVAYLLTTPLSKTASIIFRIATSNDCQLIYNWQSNKGIREHFINPNTPTWEEHSQWYKACILDSNRKLYLLDNNVGQTVGLLRLDKINNTNYSVDTYEISILIDPEHQGFGYAIKALKQLITLIKSALYLATVATENYPSHKAFSLAGFHKTSGTTYQLHVENFQSIPIEATSTNIDMKYE